MVIQIKKKKKVQRTFVNYFRPVITSPKTFYNNISSMLPSSIHLLRRSQRVLMCRVSSRLRAKKAILVIEHGNWHCLFIFLLLSYCAS